MVERYKKTLLVVSDVEQPDLAKALFAHGLFEPHKILVVDTEIAVKTIRTFADDYNLAFDAQYDTMAISLCDRAFFFTLNTMSERVWKLLNKALSQNIETFIEVVGEPKTQREKFLDEQEQKFTSAVRVFTATN